MDKVVASDRTTPVILWLESYLIDHSFFEEGKLLESYLIDHSFFEEGKIPRPLGAN